MNRKNPRKSSPSDRPLARGGIHRTLIPSFTLTACSAAAVLTFGIFLGVVGPASSAIPGNLGAEVRKAAKAPLPNGSFRAKGGVERVKDGKRKVLCARASRDTWTAGSLWRAVRIVRNAKPYPWVIGYLSMAFNLEKEAKSKRGPGSAKVVAKLKKRVNSLVKQGKTLDKVCRKKAGADQAALKLKGQFRRAVALAIGKDDNSSSGPLFTIRKRDSRLSSDELEVVSALTVSGFDSRGKKFSFPADVFEVEEGPGSFVYLGTGLPREVQYNEGIDFTEVCNLAVANVASDETECIRKAGAGRQRHVALESGDSLQTDSKGRLYYMMSPSTPNGSLELRRFDPTTGKDVAVISGLLPQVSLSRWLVLGGGGLIVSGMTYPNGFGPNSQPGSPWTRWVASDGGQEETLSTSLQYSMQELPDGNVYLVEGPFIRRILVGDAAVDGAARPTLDPKAWIAFDSSPQTEPPHFTRDDLCPDPVTRWALPPGTQWPACSQSGGFHAQANGPWSGEPFQESGGRAFSGNYSNSGVEVLKIFGPESDSPRAEAIWTRDELGDVGGFTVESGQLVLYGPSREDGRVNHIVVQDPSSADQTIVGGDLGRIDVSSVGALGDGQAAFSGWQNSTNRYVLGLVDVQEKTARITDDIKKPMSVIIPLN